MHSEIVGIEYYLPEKVLTTSELSVLFPEWGVEKIDAKTGIHERHISAADEIASDLGVRAANKLFKSGICCPDEIDFLLLCTQSPDYILPATACLLQERLGIPQTAGALDFNLGCSGFVYGLGIAEGLIASGQARSILLITTDTITKYIRPQDKSLRTLFGDGAAAIFIQARELAKPLIGPFVYGTDGKGFQNIIIRNGGARGATRSLCNDLLPKVMDEQLLEPDYLYMNGSEVFRFATMTVPSVISALLSKAQLELDDIDVFIFHQANKYILEELRRILEIPSDKFHFTMAHCANTVSSSIPIALKHAAIERDLGPGTRIMLVAFGVGYSWAATIMQWTGLGQLKSERAK